jgi:diacylglycerol kinase family enzyme
MDATPLLSTMAASLAVSVPHLLVESDGFVSSGKPAQVRLTSTSLELPSGAALALCDIVGATSEGSRVTVQSWPMSNSRTGVRSRCLTSFEASGASAPRLAALWACILCRAARAGEAASLAQAPSFPEGAGGAASVGAEADFQGPLAYLAAPGAVAQQPPPRRLLAYINPIAGSGKGRAMFSEVEPLLLDAGFALTPVVLGSRGEATRTLAVMPAAELEAFEGILAVGGDGSLSEVVEGLMARRDWARMLGRLRVGLLPSGSGNGLAISLAVAAGLPPSPWTAAHAIAKGGGTAVDLASTFVLWGRDDDGGSGVDPSPSGSPLPELSEGGAAGGGKQLNPLWTPPPGSPPPSQLAGAAAPALPQLRQDGVWGSRRFSFLSLEWAIVADIDIESENLRFLGSARFDVYGFYRCLWLRRYRGRFSYLPPMQQGGQGGGAGAPKQQQQQQRQQAAPGSGSDGSASAEGEGPDCPGGGIPTGLPTGLPTLSHLVPFNHALPPTWRTLEGVFTLLWAVNSSHQSSGVSVSPTASHSDGQWTVVLMRDKGVCGITGALLALDMEGSISRCSGVETVQCVAWRLEPEVGGVAGYASPRSKHREPFGNVCLDGEGVEYGPVQGEVHPGLLNVFSLPAKKTFF